jgi:hypothetical protein
MMLPFVRPSRWMQADVAFDRAGHHALLGIAAPDIGG